MSSLILDCGLLVSVVKLLLAVYEIIQIMLKLVFSRGAGIIGDMTGKKGNNGGIVGGV